MLKLARHYERERNKPEVEQWLRAAAVKGDVSAMQNLAVLITVQPDKMKCQEAESLLINARDHAKDPRQRQDIEQTLYVFRSGFRGEGPCVAWLGEKP